MNIVTVYHLPVKNYVADLEVPKPICADEENLLKLKQTLLNDIEIVGRCIEVELSGDRFFHFYCEAEHSAAVASRLSTLRKMWHMRPVIYPNQIKVMFNVNHRPEPQEVTSSFYTENNITSVPMDQISVKMLQEEGRGEYSCRFVFPGKVRSQIPEGVIKLFGQDNVYADKLGLSYCRGYYSLAHSTMECRKQRSRCFNCGGHKHNGSCRDKIRCVRCSTGEHTSQQIADCPNGTSAIVRKISNFFHRYTNVHLERKDFSPN